MAFEIGYMGAELIRFEAEVKPPPLPKIRLAAQSSYDVVKDDDNAKVTYTVQVDVAQILGNSIAQFEAVNEKLTIAYEPIGDGGYSITFYPNELDVVRYSEIVIKHRVIDALGLERELDMPIKLNYRSREDKDMALSTSTKTED